MFKKFVSLTTALAFLSSFIVAPSVQGAVAYAEGVRSASQARSALAGSPPVFGIDISPTNGRITDVRDFGAGPLVINIQDLHCHPEVQRNIAALLGQIERSYSTGRDAQKRTVRVFVEGGYGTVDTSWIEALKDPALRSSLMTALVESGHITGAELYAMQTNRPTMLTGLEDEALHKGNIVRLGKILENKPRYEQSLATLRRELAVMQARHFTTQNKRLSRIIARYRAGDMSSAAYYALLGKYVEKIGASPRQYNNTFSISHDQYPNIVLLRSMAAQSKGMNFRLVSTQMQKFMQSLRGVMSFADYNALVSQTQNFKDMDRLYLALAAAMAGPESAAPWVAGARRELTRFRALQTFFSYVLMKQKLNPVQLVREERLLVEQLRSAFSRSTPELEVAFLTDYFDCYSGYLLNRLSADDYGYFASRFEKFQSVWGKYTFENRIKALAGDYPLLNDYYAVNARRNTVFLRALDAFLVSGDNRVAVIVSGGFHTEGLTALLANRKISSATITPGVTQDTHGSESTYVRHALDQSRMFGAQALQLVLGSFGAKVQNVTDKTIEIVIGNLPLTIAHDGSVITPLATEAAQALKNAHAPASAEALNAALKGMITQLSALSSPTLLSVADMVMKLGQAVIASGSTLGWWGEEGLIWKIASDPDVQKKITGISYDINEIAQFPAFLQEAIFQQLTNQEELIRRAEGNSFITALVESGVVGRLIALLLTQSDAGPAVTPRTHDIGKRWGWSDNAIKFILAPLAHWENLRLITPGFSRSFANMHDNRSDIQKAALERFAARSAVVSTAVGIAAIAANIAFGFMTGGLSWLAVLPAWYLSGSIQHFIWNLRHPDNPATMGGVSAQGPMLQINALAFGAHLSEDGKLVSGTWEQLEKEIKDRLDAGYREFYLVGLLQRGELATRLAQGDRQGRANYEGYYASGEKRIVIHTPWNGIEQDLGIANPDPEHAKKYITGSSFATKDPKKIDEEWGSEEQLVRLRNLIRERGGRLIMDVVPNHIGPDNTWLDDVTDVNGEKVPNWQATVHINLGDIFSRSDLEQLTDDELFNLGQLRAKSKGTKLQGVYDLQGKLWELGMEVDTLNNIPRYAVYYTRPGDPTSRILIAYGKDTWPGGAPWIDTLQLDYTNPIARAYVLDTIAFWAEKHIDVRMDMAYLLMRKWFKHTWFNNLPREIQDQKLATWDKEFWDEVIEKIMTPYPDFQITMETYQDHDTLMKLHPRIRMYNKELYDNLLGHNIEAVKAYLRHWSNQLNSAEQEKRKNAKMQTAKLVHFIQNHDDGQLRDNNTTEFMMAAKLLISTIFGEPMIHEEETRGISRHNIQVLRPEAIPHPSTPNPAMQKFSDAMAAIAADPLFRQGNFQLAESGNSDLIAYTREYRGRRALVVVNLSNNPGTLSISLPKRWQPKEGNILKLKDAFFPYKTDNNIKKQEQRPVYYRHRSNLDQLYTKLGGYDAHIFFVEEMSEQDMISDPDNPETVRVSLDDEDISDFEKNIEEIVDLESWQKFLGSRGSLGDLNERSSDELSMIMQNMPDYLWLWQEVRAHASEYYDLTPEEKNGYTQEQQTALRIERQAMLREGLGMVRCTSMDDIRKAYNKLVNIYRLRAPPDSVLLGILPRNFKNDDAIVQFVENNPGASWVYPVAANQGVPFEVNDALAVYSDTFRSLVDRLHAIGRKVMIDAVVNHMGIANRLLDDRPELFEHSNLPDWAHKEFRAIVDQLEAVSDRDVREAARMTLNTLHTLADALMKQERNDHPDSPWYPGGDVDNMKNRMYFFDSVRVAERIEAVIEQHSANPRTRDAVRVLLLKEGLLQKFLSLDKAVTGAQVAWDAEKFGPGGGIPNSFLRIQHDVTTNEYHGIIFVHANDKVTQGSSCWTNLVQFDWSGNTTAVKDYVITLLTDLVQRYGVDGFRLDAAHWLTQNDATREFMKEIQGKVRGNTGRNIEFIVETYVPFLDISGTGMKAFMFEFRDAIREFLDGRFVDGKYVERSKAHLIDLFKKNLSPGVAFLQSHDDSQSNTFVEKIRERWDTEPRAEKKAAIARVIQTMAGVDWTYRNADETFKQPAELMKYITKAFAWLTSGKFDYLNALDARLDALRLRYDFMRNNTRYVFDVRNDNIFAGAKWDDNNLAIWSVAVNSEENVQSGEISPQQMQRWNNFVNKRIDATAMYRVRDAVTGEVFKEMSGREILDQGVPLFLSKDRSGQKKRLSEWLAKSDEKRTPPFQILMFERIEDKAAAQASRIRAIQRKIVTVGDYSGYVCGKDDKNIYVAMPSQVGTASQEEIVLMFSNNIRAVISPDMIFPAEDGMVVVAVPIYQLTDADPNVLDDNYPEWHEKKLPMASSIRGLLTAQQSPSPDATVLIISGKPQTTALQTRMGKLTSAAPDSVRTKDIGSLILHAGRVVGMITDIDASGAYTTVTAERIVAYLHHHVPHAAFIGEASFSVPLAPDAAILPKNRGRVDARARESRATVLGVDAFVAFIEWWPSMLESALGWFGIGNFVEQHGADNKGANDLITATRIGMAVGLAAGVFSGMALFGGFIPGLPVALSLAAVLFAGVGTVTNLVAHMIIDHTPVKRIVNAARAEHVVTLNWQDKPRIATALKTAAGLFVKNVKTHVEIWASSTNWFQQPWGRDTFISLPGLLLATGRFKDARRVMEYFAARVHEGLVPNMIKDGVENTIYNNADGSMWFIQAVKQYAESNPGETAFIHQMLVSSRKIVAAYMAGTSYVRNGETCEIRMDADGLIISPAQATWMDADPTKNSPVTPRDGKAVEINALWYANLRFLAVMEGNEGNEDDATRYNELADRVQTSFNAKFWNPAFENDGTQTPLFDVIETQDPQAKAIRPNMLIAVSHGGDLLAPDRQQQVLDVAEKELLTPYGLRTLAPKEEKYEQEYNTNLDPSEKDLAYHQGTVWPWLIGPYIDALVKVRTHQKVRKPAIRREIQTRLAPLVEFLLSDPNGSLPEVFDGSPRKAKEGKGARQLPGGTASQAWSVAEVLRVLVTYGIIDREAVKISAGQSSNTTGNAAILPENEARFTRMANQAGMTAWRLAGFPTLADFRPSMRAALGRGEFVAEHGDRNDGAKTLVAATRWGWVAGAVVGGIAGQFIFGVPLGMVATGVAGLILAGPAVNLITHMHIDLVMAKSLLDDVRQNGFATLEGGDVHSSVFIVNTPPAGIENLNAFIIGTTLSGKKIWAMATDNGKVVFYSEAPYADVMRAIAERAREQAPAGIYTVNDFQEHVRGLLLEALSKRTDLTAEAQNAMKEKIQGAVMGTPVWRTMDTPGTGITYDTASGAVVVSRDASAGVARVVSTADAFALGRSFLKYVGTTSDRFMAAQSVSALLSLAGEQVVVDGVARAQQLRQLALDRKIPMEIYALIGADEATLDSIETVQKTGLAGCVVQQGSSYKLVVFATASDSSGHDDAVSADMIDIFGQEARDIENKVRNSQSQCHILDVSSVVMQMDAERDLLAKQALRDLLGPRILAFFSAHSYSERYVQDAVYGMPTDQMTEAVRTAYLARMRAEIKDTTRFSFLEHAFDTAWKERLVSEAWILPEFAASISLRHRQMISRAVASLPAGAERVTVNTQDIPQLNEENIVAAYQKARADKQPNAVSALIMMIELFDQQFTGSITEIVQPQNMQAFVAVLSAA